jgi:hypothetical protein
MSFGHGAREIAIMKEAGKVVAECHATILNKNWIFFVYLETKS